MPEPALAREGALARMAAPSAVDFDRERRRGARFLVEQTGKITLEGPAGLFVLTAQSRPHRGQRSGRADVLDFKTGKPPSRRRDEEPGFSPQLTLTAAILRPRRLCRGEARFAPGELAYVRVLGARDGLDPAVVRADAAERARRLAELALDGLAPADRPASTSRAQTYVSWAAPQFMNQLRRRLRPPGPPLGVARDRRRRKGPP